MYWIFTLLSFGCKRFIKTRVTTFWSEHDERSTQYTFSWADTIVYEVTQVGQVSSMSCH